MVQFLYFAFACPINRTLYSKQLDNIYLLGASGAVQIDSSGDRMSALQLKNVQNGKYIRVANFFSSKDQLEMLGGTITWPGGTKQVPLGRPKCGFDGELCAAPKKAGIEFLGMIELNRICGQSALIYL